jgi:molybdenum storage protein
LVKDVDGLYDRDPRSHTDASLIREIDTAELRQRNFETLPFDRVLLDLLDNARLLQSFQIVNGRHPDRIIAAIEGEKVGTIVYANQREI